MMWIRLEKWKRGCVERFAQTISVHFWLVLGGGKGAAEGDVQKGLVRRLSSIAIGALTARHEAMPSQPV